MLYLELTHYDNNNIKSCFYVKNKDTGVGNMLFQISSCIAFSIKNNISLYVIGLNTFLIFEELQKDKTIFRYINEIEYPVNISNFIDLAEKSRELIYDSFTYTENICVHSYFENYKNFDEYKDIIIQKFAPSTSDINYLIEKYPLIQNDETTSLHIRCGPIYRRNYEITKDNILVNQLTLLYYKGLDKMIEIRNIKTVIICTDDVDYCFDILKNNNKYKDIQFRISNERDYMDIWLMSLIKNNIVSFSTLSWWGAYLNNREDNTIVCCKEFRDDLHQSNWIIV